MMIVAHIKFGNDNLPVYLQRKEVSALQQGVFKSRQGWNAIFADSSITQLDSLCGMPIYIWSLSDSKSLQTQYQSL